MNIGLLAIATATSLLLLGIFIRRRLLDGRVGPTRLSRYADARAAETAAVAIRRLANPSDIYFLRLQPGYEKQLERKMRWSRRSVLNLFLRQHYAEFRGLMAAAAEAARHEESDFGTDLVSLSFRFHCLYAIAWTESRVLGRISLSRPHERVAGIVRGLRGDLVSQRETGAEAHGL
jgi:hypothetical protein